MCVRGVFLNLFSRCKCCYWPYVDFLCVCVCVCISGVTQFVQHQSVKILIQSAETFQTEGQWLFKQPEVARTLSICQSLERYISVFITNLSNLSVIYHESVYFINFLTTTRPVLELDLHATTTIFTFYYHRVMIGLQRRIYIKLSIASLEALYSSGLR